VIAVGEVIHGFCGGLYGRESFGCRRVEAVGADWVLTRTLDPTFWQPEIEVVFGVENLRHLEAVKDERGFCSESATLRECPAEAC
jgi:hypothetical protein